MVDPLAMGRRWAFRLGMLMAIMALTLLVPVILLLDLAPARLRHGAVRRLAALRGARVPVIRRGARRVAAETADGPYPGFPARHRMT
jgi:hypothetical protein